MQALQWPFCLQAASAAAKAFRGLCIRCAARLTNPADVEGLIGPAHTTLQTSTTSSSGAAVHALAGCGFGTVKAVQAMQRVESFCLKLIASHWSSSISMKGIGMFLSCVGQDDTANILG